MIRNDTQFLSQSNSGRVCLPCILEVYSMCYTSLVAQVLYVMQSPISPHARVLRRLSRLRSRYACAPPSGHAVLRAACTRAVTTGRARWTRRDYTLRSSNAIRPELMDPDTWSVFGVKTDLSPRVWIRRRNADIEGRGYVGGR